MSFKSLRHQMYEEMLNADTICDFYKKYFGTLLHKLEKIEELCKTSETAHMEINSDFAKLVEDKDEHDLDIYCSGRFVGMEDVKFAIRKILTEPTGQ